MRVVFMGTPPAAVPTLQRCLEDGHEVTAVWTQPDRPSGRGNKIHESAVKEFALARDLKIYQPSKIKSEESKALFASHKADVAVVVAYGRILPTAYLTAPAHGCVNVHFSLLPRYRGAAPVNWAIVRGESKTGVTTMLMEEELDAGPILLQHETEIGSKETATELMARLSYIGADLLSKTLAGLDSIPPRPQNPLEATFAPMLSRDDGQIDWSTTASSIELFVRGMQPWPTAFTYHRSRRLVIWQCETVATDRVGALAGEVIAAHGNNLVIGCGDQTALRLVGLQSEGARRMAARDFINGTHIQVGDKLGVGR
jgi:methionyl-tRNA formyltransferase